MPIFHLPEQNDKANQAGQEDASGQIDQADGQGSTQGKNNEIDISGGAVIKDYELVDYMTKEEVRGQLLIEGKVKGSPVTILYEESPVTYTIKQEKSKIKFEDTPEGHICHVKIETKGDVSEYSSSNHNDIFDEGNISQIQELIEKEIIRQAELAVTKSKELNTDFLQIGLQMYRTHPKWWDKYSEDWDKGVYERMPILIEVNAIVENTGILQ